MDTPDYWGVYDTPVLLAYLFITGIGKASDALEKSIEKHLGEPYCDICTVCLKATATFWK